jgi:CheY-like chemotaxis protein
MAKLYPASISDNASLAVAKILLVDDEEICLLIIKNSLTQLGYSRIDTARNGEEALAMSKLHHYDFIITDVQMPKLDGIALTKMLRQPNHINFATPIIVLTSGQDAAVKRDCLQAGASYFARKPVSGSQLTQIITHYSK